MNFEGLNWSEDKKKVCQFLIKHSGENYIKSTTLISNVEKLSGLDNFFIRKCLWTLTADGILEFGAGFGTVKRNFGAKYS